MRYLDLTLPSPAENLALDEALLAEAEDRGEPEVLRVWESRDYFVVLGLGCGVDDDADTDACRADGVPILRRASGGGTVLQGPGCLSYALVLRLDRDPALKGIGSTNRYVLERVGAALGSWHPKVAFHGISDLSIDGLKVSGNAQRRKRDWVLFHGTLLYDFDPEKVERYLRLPRRQPEYRVNRTHRAFLKNLDATGEELKARLRDVWSAGTTLDDWPRGRLGEIVEIVRRRT